MAQPWFKEKCNYLLVFGLLDGVGWGCFKSRGENAGGDSKIHSLLSVQYVCALCCFKSGEILSHGEDITSIQIPSQVLRILKTTWLMHPLPRAGGHHLCYQHLWPPFAGPAATWIDPINYVKSNISASLKKKERGKGTSRAAAAVAAGRCFLV